VYDVHFVGKVGMIGQEAVGVIGFAGGVFGAVFFGPKHVLVAVLVELAPGLADVDALAAVESDMSLQRREGQNALAQLCLAKPAFTLPLLRPRRQLRALRVSRP
jgi:hypothetical protein